MEGFPQRLTQSTAEIPAEYFNVAILDGWSIQRERVDCYELCNQLRIRRPDPCEYFLNVEMDKRAHSVLQQMCTRISHQLFYNPIP